MNILSSLEQNILVFVKISVVLKMLYSRSDFYFLWRFMCAGVYHCHCIQRSVKDVHLELCALGYYCIRMKYWTIFKKKKRKMENAKARKKKLNESGDFSTCASSLYAWCLCFLLKKMWFSMECREKMLWRVFTNWQYIYLFTFHPDTLHIIMRLPRLHIKRRTAINQAGGSSSFLPLIFRVFFFFSFTNTQSSLITHRGNTILHATVTLFIW